MTLVVSLHGRVSDATAGLLTALLTAPQLLGLLAAEPLARARDPRRVLAAAFAGLGVALSACGLLVEHRNLALAAAAAAAAGCAGPLVTGGLSAQSITRRADDLLARRRAEALDAATYGLGSTVGPIVVVPSGVDFCARRGRCPRRGGARGRGGALILPAAAAIPARPGPDGVGEVLVAIAGVGPLRRVWPRRPSPPSGRAACWWSRWCSAPVSGSRRRPAPRGRVRHRRPGRSAALTVRPLRTEPERTTLTLMATAGASVALCALAPDEAAAAVVFTLAGAVAAAQFTASLAVRSAYAPPGTRAHVYVTMASLKVGCASAGAALAGRAADRPRPALSPLPGSCGRRRPGHGDAIRVPV